MRQHHDSGDYSRPDYHLLWEIERNESDRQPDVVWRRRIKGLLGVVALLLLIVALGFWFGVLRLP